MWLLFDPFWLFVAHVRVNPAACLVSGHIIYVWQMPSLSIELL